MTKPHLLLRSLLGAGVVLVASGRIQAQDIASGETAPPISKAWIDGAGDGFRALTGDDFTKVNSADDTWTFKDDAIYCTGRPVSVIRTKKQFTNFELVVQWMHHKPAGNSGVFVWTTPESIEQLTKAGKPGLPRGIEVQVLDVAYGQPNPADWYTSHGDVFPVGVKMDPFPPLAPNGQRSFPSKNLVRAHGAWNHYYVRAINGEVRLWVNGEEVSGGANC
ncbi:MAG: DUF1080 domain-containing protein, partial [Planctomycetota bacterium]